MRKYYVGLDVPKLTIAIAVLAQTNLAFNIKSSCAAEAWHSAAPAQ